MASHTPSFWNLPKMLAVDRMDNAAGLTPCPPQQQKAKPLAAGSSKPDCSERPQDQFWADAQSVDSTGCNGFFISLGHLDQTLPSRSRTSLQLVLPNAPARVDDSSAISAPPHIVKEISFSSRSSGI